MSRGAFLHYVPPHRRGEEVGVIWASVVAVLFAAVAALSFAVDQSVTLSPLPAPSAYTR